MPWNWAGEACERDILIKDVAWEYRFKFVNSRNDSTSAFCHFHEAYGACAFVEESVMSRIKALVEYAEPEKSISYLLL